VSLRERKKLDTRRALSDAALELVLDKGLDHVTREDIASRAGVSLRTFSNYFAGKHEALAYRQVERFRRSLDVLRERPADEPIWQAVTRAVLAPLEDEVGGMHVPTREQLAEIRAVVTSPESQLAVSNEIAAQWVAVVAERTGTDPDRDLHPHLVVNVLAAVVKTATEAYVRADPPVLITTVLEHAFGAVTVETPAPGSRA
jgi:AcrR family transcriptional regulator